MSAFDEVLRNIERAPDVRALKRAYHRASLRYHPNKQVQMGGRRNDPVATERFARIGQAYERRMRELEAPPPAPPPAPRRSPAIRTPWYRAFWKAWRPRPRPRPESPPPASAPRRSAEPSAARRPRSASARPDPVSARSVSRYPRSQPRPRPDARTSAGFFALLAEALDAERRARRWSPALKRAKIRARVAARALSRARRRRDALSGWMWRR